MLEISLGLIGILLLIGIFWMVGSVLQMFFDQRLYFVERVVLGFFGCFILALFIGLLYSVGSFLMGNFIGG